MNTHVWISIILDCDYINKTSVLEKYMMNLGYSNPVRSVWSSRIAYSVDIPPDPTYQPPAVLLNPGNESSTVPADLTQDDRECSNSIDPMKIPNERGIAYI